MEKHVEIYESFVNGQFEQMIRQLVEINLYDFSIILEKIEEDFDAESALKIAIKYCKNVDMFTD